MVSIKQKRGRDRSEEEELIKTKDIRLSYRNLLITLYLGFRTQRNQVGNELEACFLLDSIIILKVAVKASGREKFIKSFNKP